MLYFVHFLQPKKFQRVLDQEALKHGLTATQVDELMRHLVDPGLRFAPNFARSGQDWIQKVFSNAVNESEGNMKALAAALARACSNAGMWAFTPHTLELARKVSLWSIL